MDASGDAPYLFCGFKYPGQQPVTPPRSTGLDGFKASGPSQAQEGSLVGQALGPVAPSAQGPRAADLWV